jgi:hypothetical protein
MAGRLYTAARLLAITSGEALYADMGHLRSTVGTSPIEFVYDPTRERDRPARGMPALRRNSEDRRPPSKEVTP